jgi:hypothetical protein
VRALWERRSSIDLVGNHIDSHNGAWVARDSSIAGSIDSFFEYLLKASILFGDAEYNGIFTKVRPIYLDINGVMKVY